MAALLLGAATPGVAGPLDVRPWLTQESLSTVRTIDPLINYLLVPWPIAWIHTLERTDRFTNVSPSTPLTLTGLKALALSPEDVGYADLNASNATAAEQAAFAAHGDYSLWDSDWLPFDVKRSVWSPPTVRPLSPSGASLVFPITLRPQESLRVASRTISIGDAGDLGELLIGWQVSGFTEAVAPPRLGDVDSDGRIDLADFAVLKQNMGRSGASWSQGDLDGDGHVGLGDFGLFKSAFGAPAAAPEPAAGGLALVGWLALCFFSRRVRRAPG